ncbi:molybdopterin molybdotransferase MoeA [Fulvivirga ulvae]|uniref:molybdopterin molybdotransferase MoeA n=1 Tax=Fulvivirga ulvae TaxID=2904245 RepID=UPI001F4166B3|nr:molybdopterin molybdotransferase MoeA [Fulvivirga ulvae]UII29828.1 molybdopterin molybdotransferase MoeA [Fulvivirga ulvae]
MVESMFCLRWHNDRPYNYQFIFKLNKSTKMISVEEAIDIVMSHTIEPGTEKVPLESAVDRVLQEDVSADRDFPPFNRVMMDGIAVNSNAWQEGRREFYVEGMQTAGAPQQRLSQEQNCIEVMTGAMLPQNTDVVIRYEDVEIEDNVARVRIDEVKLLQNVHLKGTDRKQDDVLIHKNQILSPAEIAILATVGKHTVEVVRHLKVAIVSTGDELVDVNEMPNPYQIRRSNTYALQSALQADGYEAHAFHINDEKDALETKLREIVEKYDTIILSGGVSKGKKDYVPEILEKLRVKKLFHGVKQRPGKPFWFGVREEGNSPTVIFALPGNPVSTFMCFYTYTLPWLEKCYKLNNQVLEASLTTDFNFQPPLTYFLQVKLTLNQGQLLATPVTGQGSGDLANLLEADAFLRLPSERTEFKGGEIFPVLRYRRSF